MKRAFLMACFVALCANLAACTKSEQSSGGANTHSSDEFNSDLRKLNDDEFNLSLEGCKFSDNGNVAYVNCGTVPTEGKIAALNNYRIAAELFLNKYSGAVVKDGDSSKQMTQEFKRLLRARIQVCGEMSAKVRVAKQLVDQADAVAKAKAEEIRLAYLARHPLMVEITKAGIGKLDVEFDDPKVVDAVNNGKTVVFRDGKIQDSANALDSLPYCAVALNEKDGKVEKGALPTQLILIDEANDTDLHSVVFNTEKLPVKVFCKKKGADAYTIKEIQDTFGEPIRIGVRIL